MRFLIVASELDPVGRATAERWGTPPASDWHVDGAPIRWVRPEVGLLRRAPHHLHDDFLDSRLPTWLLGSGLPLVFPSIHRSESGTATYTVHPLGNPGGSAELGGKPRRLVPAAPRLMTDALRRLSEEGAALGLPACFEATHHGPFLETPAFFAEIGGEPSSSVPGAAAVGRLANVLPELEEDPRDLPVVGIGGGHYAPHFTDLARRRHWAFGHILSRHALSDLDPDTARAAWSLTPGAAGTLWASARDGGLPVAREIGPRRSESEAPRRIAGSRSTLPASARASRPSET